MYSVCILTQLVTIASKCKGLDVCTFHNYVMTELICGVLNSSSTLAHLYCIVSTHAAKWRDSSTCCM